MLGIAAGATSSSAQPNVRDHRTPPPPPAGERDHRRPPPPADPPREAPPSPREERIEARAGFVWIQGRWDWRAGKWDWIPGHWERERAGKHWNPGHWDKQGDHWLYVEGGWGAGGAPPPPPPADRHEPPPPPAAPPAADGRPHEAPPPPRTERIETRAGFVWVRGRWDWRAGKWDWIPGHWERERAGKHWREARWEQRDGGYVLIDGEWVDASAAPPPPPPPAPPAPDRGDRGDHHREWKLDRPMVSSFWPVKGKIGSRIVIRGRNFPEDTAVLWGGAQVAGAKVEPDRIVVAVPAGATSGTLSLRTGRHRELTVGNYEVANYDAEAEARRIAEEERKRAEQAWAERQKLLAKDRAARLAAIDHHHRELSESREQRRADRLREIRAKWEAAFLADPDTQAELTLHAQRGAELARMREVAELSENGKLVIRIGIAQSREDDRHQARMTALHDGFGRKP
ncbi:MAG TPA: IPT/TIG domain-containing protein [Kofleriaceae bacterium]|nr:IPT/TIG domain-containing protein [Kofleriaceae bacterium]